MACKQSLLKLTAISGMITPIMAFSCILLAISYSPSFSWTENALSDLGIQAGITAPLFNYGLITSGVLALAFSTGLLVLFSHTILDKVGATNLIATVLALIAIGIFNEDFKPTHYIVSVAFFTLFPLSMTILMTAHLHSGRKTLAIFTLAIAIVAAAPWLFQLTMQFVPNVAIPETISALAASTWIEGTSLNMLKEIARPKPDDDTCEKTSLRSTSKSKNPLIELTSK